MGLVDAAEVQAIALRGNAVGGGKAYHDFAAAVADVAAQPGKPHAAPADDPPQLAGGDGQVGADDHDAAALVRSVLPDALLNRFADVFPADGQVMQAPVVRQNQHAHGEGLTADLHKPGGGTDAALQVVAGHALARAHVALGKVRRRGGNGGEHLRLPHRPVTDVIQGCVVALAHHGVHGRDRIPPALPLAAHVFHHGVVNQPHVQGVRQGDGGFQRPQLPDLHQPGGFSKAVENVVSRGHFIAENVVLAG